MDWGLVMDYPCFRTPCVGGCGDRVVGSAVSVGRLCRWVRGKQVVVHRLVVRCCAVSMGAWGTRGAAATVREWNERSDPPAGSGDVSDESVYNESCYRNHTREAAE